MASIAVLGLGVIGVPIARNAAKVAKTLYLWNRTAAKVYFQ